MSQSHTPSRPSPRAKPPEPRRESASTADGILAERVARAERERRTAQVRTAARRLDDAADPRP